MKNTIKITEILLEYDGPILVLAECSKKNQYIGVCYENEEFYFIPFMPNQEKPRDLLEVIKEEAENILFGYFFGSVGDSVDLRDFKVEALNFDMLPSPGLMI